MKVNFLCDSEEVCAQDGTSALEPIAGIIWANGIAPPRRVDGGRERGLGNLVSNEHNHDHVLHCLSPTHPIIHRELGSRRLG